MERSFSSVYLLCSYSQGQVVSASTHHLSPCCSLYPAGRMGIELYLDLLSPPCRSVYIFAKKNNIPFTFKQMEVLKGQQHSDGFGKVNILRKVPALKDGGFTLAESPAILTYLSQKYKTPDHWYPLDMKKRARVDEYLSWHHSAIRSSVFKIFWLKNMDRTFCPRASTFAKGLEGLWLTKCLTDWRPLVVFPLYMDQTAPEEKLQEALEDLTIPLKQLEEKFLQDKPFLVGNMISLADLVAVTELMQLIAIGYNILEDRPKLVEWRNRVEKAVGKELFQEAHKVILNFQDLNSMLIEPQLKEQMKPRLLKMVA
ncbi:glutathione S-transferase theta-1-like isoform X1 [Malaclemys terrapin pileata]|uniref:glutathione S-transferase theta-1-like isoform X1 n=1 Tax=Malaclemys terrapin pileata TaxID=2991368 RepID=UPI0023A8AE99|nr:glutathione S-transferase theta-1-like isoform X1 [Malaclemys terrapin pileata]